MADLEKILKRRKPIADDTLSLLIDDLAKRTAADNNKYLLMNDPFFIGWKNDCLNITKASQEELDKIVLKMSDEEYKRHRRNMLLYNSIYNMQRIIADRLEALEHYFSLMLSCCLMEEDAIAPSPEIKQDDLDYLQKEIVKTFRAVYGFNYFMEAAKEKLPVCWRLSWIVYNFELLRDAYNHYSEDLMTHQTKNDYNKISTDLELLQLQYFDNDIRETITGYILPDLNGFSNAAQASYSMSIILRQSYLDDEQSIDDIKRMIEENGQIIYKGDTI